MDSPRRSTRQRIIQAAITLFTKQGVTETTTRQIADLAEVNEVTLFRNFGNKHGLLLAVMEDSAVFTQLGESLALQATQTSGLEQALKEYASARLQALEQIPQFVRSVVGEAGQYPIENRQALGKSLNQANRYVALYLATVVQRQQLHTHLPVEKLASLLNGMLLGYAVMGFTSEFHQLWQNRDDFLESLVALFLHGAVSELPIATDGDLDDADLEPSFNQPLREDLAALPAPQVHAILRQAKLGLQEYALTYLLFGAGVSVTEIIELQRSHYLSHLHHHLLQIPPPSVRQVPINQWIMGKRYGSPMHNPVSRWLRSRKDNQSTLFLASNNGAITAAEVQQLWRTITEGLLTPEGRPLAIAQTQHTWRVEMLTKGMSLEDLSILTGLEPRQLQPYILRARERELPLEQALRLDQKV